MYSNKSRSSGSFSNNNKGNTDIVVKIDSIARHMLSLEKMFASAGSSSPHISFERECVFAKHIVNNNNYLADIAVNNPKSFETAFLQLASSGLTLDPAQKQAYLVPRDGRVILDVSYIGLSRMATDEGLCEDIVAELVFEKDSFKTNGRRSSPDHEFDPFAYKGGLVLTNTDQGALGDRGMFRGAYVDYLMKDGRHLVFFIDLQDLAQSRAKSESWAKVEKRQYSPWTQFPWKMVLKSAIKQTIHLIPGNRTRLSSMIEYLNTAGGEGFRTATIPVAAAEAEMEVRQEARTAGNTDTTIRTAKSDDKVIEGEFNKLPEEPDSTEQQDIKSNTPTDVYDTAEGNTPPADVNGSADDILPPPGETNGQSNEEMSEHPGVRKWAERRIKKLVSRAEKTLGYETILNDAKSSFDLNESELAFARLSLEKTRRSLLKNHLTNAVGSFDFTQVLNFIEKMGKGEFKTDAAKWVGEVQAESMEIHKLYLEAVNTSDFVRLNAALNNVTFPPLKEMVEGLIEDLLAA